MESNYEKHGASINTLFNVLYHTLQGKKVPYNDVVQKVKQLFPIILPELIASPDHNAIVKNVVDRYVSEVGIQTFDPEFIDLDREAKYWPDVQTRKRLRLQKRKKALLLAMSSPARPRIISGSSTWLMIMATGL